MAKVELQSETSQMSDLSDVPTGCMYEFFRVDIRFFVSNTKQTMLTTLPSKAFLSDSEILLRQKFTSLGICNLWFVRPMLYHSPIQTLLTACVSKTLKSLSSHAQYILVKSSQFKKSNCILTEDSLGTVKRPHS